MSKFVFIIILTLCGIFWSLNSVQAALVPCGTSEHPAECTLCDLFGLVQNALNLMLFFLAIVSLLVAIIIGYMFFAGSIQPDSLATAKKALTAAFAGFFLVLVAWLIVFSIGKAMGWKEEAAGRWWEISCEAE